MRLSNKAQSVTFCFISCAIFSLCFSSGAQGQGVVVARNDKVQRVDVLIDGRPFTSYVWAEELKKPILFPLRTANGTIITRGFPIEPRAGESIDHPHQAGLWFNYGDVNGVDFWNNSIYRSKQETARMGSILHRRIVSTKNGKTQGELLVEMDWLMPDGERILREDTKFVFHAGKDYRSIDRITTLTAIDKKVVFNDSKEGLFGLRVRRELEQPTKEPIRLTDAEGKPSEKPVLDNTNVSGEYLSSEGKIGDEVWGTRARWASLSGKVGNEDITIAILDDPQNLGFPTYWMARGYGLFAANPLGQKAYSSEKKEPVVREMKLTLEPKKSVTFRFRIVIFSSKATPAQIDSQYKDFTNRASQR
jgi:hypothetical protein